MLSKQIPLGIYEKALPAGKDLLISTDFNRANPSPLIPFEIRYHQKFLLSGVNHIP